MDAKKAQPPTASASIASLRLIWLSKNFRSPRKLSQIDTDELADFSAQNASGFDLVAKFPVGFVHTDNRPRAGCKPAIGI